MFKRWKLKRITRGLIGLIFSLTSFMSPGQDGDFAIGFKIISTYDSNRIYKPNSSLSEKLHFRPIDIDLWYPAKITSSDSAASFASLVNLLEQRSNFYDDTRKYNGLTDELLQYICAGLNCPDSIVLKKLKTDSYINAKPIEKEFPLIVYLSGFNGMSYENYLLFESLVKKGFIVASVSSIGRYPGNMTMDTADIFEQIKDGQFVIDNLAKEKLISNDIGLVGYSWGGLAATIMAMTEPHKFKAVVSLDGSEQFTYADEEEDEKLNLIRKEGFFNPNLIKSPFLYLDSDIAEWDNSPDSIYNITDYIPGDKCYLRINQATHEDFSSLSVLLAKNLSQTKYDLIQQLTVNYLLDKLKNQNVFYESIPGERTTNQFSQPFKTTSVLTDKKVLKGLIRDKKSNLPLPYVNIGVVNGDKGTTSNIKGEFELILSESHINDTLRISMIGYDPIEFYLADVLKREKLYLNVHLNEKTNELKEIVVVDKKLTTRILGNKTDSKFIGARFAPGDLGSEIAIKLKIKDAPTYLDSFSFNISYNTGDTATFRVNIYNIKNGRPDKNILTQIITLKVNGQAGKIDVDLSKYDIVAHEDFFIGLEWIEGENNGIVFSSGFLNKGTYYRKASQGHWRKFRMGVGFHVTVKY